MYFCNWFCYDIFDALLTEFLNGLRLINDRTDKSNLSRNPSQSLGTLNCIFVTEMCLKVTDISITKIVTDRHTFSLWRCFFWRHNSVTKSCLWRIFLSLVTNFSVNITPFFGSVYLLISFYYILFAFTSLFYHVP